MKTIINSLSVAVVVLSSVLAGCSGAPADENEEVGQTEEAISLVNTVGHCEQSNGKLTGYCLGSSYTQICSRKASTACPAGTQTQITITQCGGPALYTSTLTCN